jgi:vancomycin resistance protein YoaR
MVRGRYAHARPKRPRSWVRLTGWCFLTLIVLAIAGVVTGYELDSRSHKGEVLRQVSLAGEDVSGMTKSELDVVVGRLGSRVSTAPVQIDAPGGGFSTNAGALGLGVNGPATERRVMKARHGDWPGSGMWAWLQSFLRPQHLSAVITVDAGSVTSTLAAHDPGQRLPVEPEVKGDTTGFMVVPGKTGTGMDAAGLVAALPLAVDHSLDPVRVSATRRTLSPHSSDDDARRLAALAGQQVSKPLPVTAGALSMKIPVPTLWSWVHSQPSPSGLRLAVDPALAQAGLAKLLPNAGPAPADTRFDVQGGAIQVAAPGTDGQSCCADGAAALIDKALFGGAFPTPQDPPLALPLKATPPRIPADLVAKLGISQVIGTFTSSYDPGQPRVTNIQRIAQLTQGYVMLPGETLSLNGVVGPRTTAKGFVAAQAIVAGQNYGTDVGGGIAQYASALLNAAYAGGLDILEYQSPSLHDPHEPLGREATISYPMPDLKLRDSTPYGVVIWNSYTDTSITVTLYSTGYATGAQTSQRTTNQGACQKVHTVRTRTYTTGKTATDSLDAFYYPGPGLPC